MGYLEAFLAESCAFLAIFLNQYSVLREKQSRQVGDIFLEKYIPHHQKARGKMLVTSHCLNLLPQLLLLQENVGQSDSKSVHFCDKRF